MAIISTKAIVLHRIKFGDTSLIVKCFTQKEGVKSYLLKGILKSKKSKLTSAHFQLMNQLNIIASHNNKGNLSYIREATVFYPYKNAQSSIVKQTILLFLSEVLSSIIQEEEENSRLYTYIENSLIWFDDNTAIANFHLVFLLKLTEFLGFFPNITGKDKICFNLQEGVFTDISYEKHCIKGRELFLFKLLLELDFDTINHATLNKKERQVILRLLIQYFELHLSGFRKPKSLDVLEVIYN